MCDLWGGVGDNCVIWLSMVSMLACLKEPVSCNKNVELSQEKAGLKSLSVLWLTEWNNRHDLNCRTQDTHTSRSRKVTFLDSSFFQLILAAPEILIQSVV